MGYPNHELIVPAILFDNPGLNKSQLERRLTQAHYSTDERSKDEPLDAHDHNFSPSDLGGILGLETTLAYERFQKPKTDAYGLRLAPPKLVVNIGNSQQGIEAVVKVIEHARNDLGREDHVLEWQVGWAGLGTVVPWHDQASQPKDFLITGKDDEWVEFKEICPVKVEEAFATFDKLYQRWPQFKPENMYDFSKNSGRFDIFYCGGNFLWKLVDGRYYLDPATFDRIGGSFLEQVSIDDKFEYGYTDLVLTAEAIKHGAWKLLSRRGQDHLEAFLQAFPESRQRHEKAVWDSYSSLSAKKRQLTIRDFLRTRVYPFVIPEEE